MNGDMTRISRESYRKATMEALTVREAVDFLEREAKVRTLREKLEKFSKGRDLSKLLVAGLLEHHPDMKKDSVERRVRGWLKPEPGHSIKKQDAIEVAFILELDVDEADEFVTLVSEERLHWRNPDEIVYIFALQNGMSYQTAVKLAGQMEGILSQVQETRELEEDSFTPMIRSQLSQLSTVEELQDYLLHAVGRLGRCHNNAYQMFLDMMDALENPEIDEVEADMFGEERLTVRDIVREYFYEDNVLYAKSNARKTQKGKAGEEEWCVLTKIQESIASSWPDEIAISRMKSRKMDVSRKILILLFLATDEEWKETGEDVFEDMYRRMNDMLGLCGFSTLDPRVPFDWLIIYCMCVTDILDMDDRMHRIFNEMFGMDPKAGGKA